MKFYLYIPKEKNTYSPFLHSLMRKKLVTYITTVVGRNQSISLESFKCYVCLAPADRSTHFPGLTEQINRCTYIFYHTPILSHISYSNSQATDISLTNLDSKESL